MYDAQNDKSQQLAMFTHNTASMIYSRNEGGGGEGSSTGRHQRFFLMHACEHTHKEHRGKMFVLFGFLGCVCEVLYHICTVYLNNKFYVKESAYCTVIANIRLTVIFQMTEGWDLFHYRFIPI